MHVSIVSKNGLQNFLSHKAHITSCYFAANCIFSWFSSGSVLHHSEHRNTEAGNNVKVAYHNLYLLPVGRPYDSL